MSCNINNITWKQRRWLNNKSLYDTVVIGFFFLTKSTSVLRSIYHAQFGKYTKFHRNPQQTRPNIGFQTCRIFPKEMYVLPPPPLPDMHLKSFRPHIFTNLQRFLMKLRIPTKVGGKIAQWSLFFTWMERKEMAKEWHRLKGPLGQGHFWSLGGDGGNSKDQRAAPLVVVNQLKPMSRFIGKVLKSSSYPHHPKKEW